jgi:hypothetical protein
LNFSLVWHRIARKKNWNDLQTLEWIDFQLEFR